MAADVLPLDGVLQLIGAAGALGTSASGLVEMFKDQTPIGTFGAGRVKAKLGGGWALLASAYGGETNLVSLIDGTFRKGPDALTPLLRAGLRLALTSKNANGFAIWVQEDQKKIEQAAVELEGGAGGTDTQPSDAARTVLGRVELRIDAHVDAAVAASYDAYAGWMRMWAGVVAILIGTVVGFATDHALQGLLVGVIAVPVAPIAKDLASAVIDLRSAFLKR